jgi:hypothetical protein
LVLRRQLALAKQRYQEEILGISVDGVLDHKDGTISIAHLGTRFLKAGAMTDERPSWGATEAVLRSLIRKLVEKNVLTAEDVRDFLEDAARHLELGGSITPEFAKDLVREDLLPKFLGETGPGQ